MTTPTLAHILRKYPDVRQKLRRRFVLPFLIYAVWLILLTAVSLWVVLPILDEDSMVVAPTVLLAAIVLPIFFLKLPQRLADRSYRGVVRSCQPYNYREPIVLRTRNDPNYIPRAVLVVEQANGKLRTLDLPLPDPYAPPPWKEGDEIIHFGGSPIHLTAGKLPTTCILCGGTSPNDAERCVFCNASLLRPQDTASTPNSSKENC